MAPAQADQHVTVLERCEVRPSPVPAAGQPRALPLMFFDLLFWDFPPVQRLFFYKHHSTHGPLDVPGFLSRELPLFKASLADALHSFHPLAGKLAHELPAEVAAPLEVVCSDNDSIRLTVVVGGDNFCDLAGDHPRNTARLRPLVPTLPKHGVFAVQFTVFPGAGICVGTTLHHAVPDGSSYVHFFKMWAAIHRDWAVGLAPVHK